MTLLLGFVLGVSAGMRSMTPIAVVAWAAQLGWPELQPDQPGVHDRADHGVGLHALRVRRARVRQAARSRRAGSAPAHSARASSAAPSARPPCARQRISQSPSAPSSAPSARVAGAFAGYHVRRLPDGEPQGSRLCSSPWPRMRSRSASRSWRSRESEPFSASARRRTPASSQRQTSRTDRAA